MSIELDRDEIIDLITDDGSTLEQICIGVKWGDIHVQKLFGGTKVKKIDLDVSVALYDAEKTPLNLVYASQLELPGIKHSGGNPLGNPKGTEELDKEIITLNLPKVHEEVAYMTIMLNSYSQINFKYIPFFSMHIYEGTPSDIKSEFATMEMDNLEKIISGYCMVIGTFYKENNEWQFKSMGITTKDGKLTELIEHTIEFL